MTRTLTPITTRRALVHSLGIIAALGLALATGPAVAQVQGVTDTEIVLGTHQDLSGPLAALGAPFRDGMILAVEEINAAGGIHGRKIRLVVEDSGYDPKKAVLITQKMLAQDKVFALIATLGTATSSVSMPLALDRGVPFLFPASAGENTYVPYHPLKFALTAPYSQQTRAGVKYAYETLGKRRFGTIYQDDDTGVNFSRAFDEQLAVHGLTAVERTTFKRGETDYASQIARLKAANVDVVMIGSNTRETAAAALEIRKQGWNVTMIASSGASTDATIKLAGDSVEGLYANVQFTSSAQLPSPGLQAVRDRYKARFGREMEAGVNQTYVSMMLFAEGARHAGRNLTPQTLAQGLEKVKDFKTVFEAPPISYGPNDHQPPRGTMVLQVRGGKWVTVAGPISF